MTKDQRVTIIKIGTDEIERVSEYKYLGQTLRLDAPIAEEVKERVKAGWRCFGKYREFLMNDALPIYLKRRIMDQCILPTITYGCQTWSRNTTTVRQIRTAQRAMERKILNHKLSDKIRASDIREQTKVIDIVEFVAKTKWKWAGHVARLTDNRWTGKVMKWLPKGKRRVGKPRQRWNDDIVACAGASWPRKAVNRIKWKSSEEAYIQQWMDTG